MIQSINPATNQIIESFEEMSPAEIQKVLSHVRNDWLEWKESSFAERSACMKKAADILRKKKSDYSLFMTNEMGKPIAQSEAEVEKCAWVCDYYADHAEAILSDEIIPTDASQSYVRFDPVGIILAVMPWNFPFWQVFRFAAPALMAGNAAVLKHASNVMRCALSIEEIFREAGFPEHLFRTLVIGSPLVRTVIEDTRIAAVTLTGSEAAGMKVAECAGRHLKKTVLELGGSDPFIVCADARVKEAAIVAATARCINTGQSCIAAKRFIVAESVADQFENFFVDEMKKKIVGDPLDRRTDIGAMAREDLLSELDAQVQSSVQMGAQVLCGGKRLNRTGVFYEATVLGNVTREMPVFNQETFGPVAAVIRVKDDEDAIAIANDSAFGLGASLWIGDIGKGKIFARRIESGNVFINGLVKSDPRLPFGGIKKSGYGRELSHYGIKEFVNIKAVWIQ